MADAEPDYVRTIQAAPNDPLYLPGAASPYSGLWFLRTIAAPAAWDTVTGSQQVRGTGEGGGRARCLAASAAPCCAERLTHQDCR